MQTPFKYQGLTQDTKIHDILLSVDSTLASTSGEDTTMTDSSLWQHSVLVVPSPLVLASILSTDNNMSWLWCLVLDPKESAPCTSEASVCHNAEVLLPLARALHPCSRSVVGASAGIRSSSLSGSTVSSSSSRLLTANRDLSKYFT